MPDVKLSGKDDKTKIAVFDETTKSSKDEERSLREIEVALLKSVFQAAFTVEKDLKKSILARDLYEQADNLVDADEKITMSAEDLQVFKTGWEALERQRPMVWIRARSLLKQLV
jgi:hypothetical protein